MHQNNPLSLMVALADPAQRANAAEALARHFHADSLLLFAHAPEPDVAIATALCPAALPDPQAWSAFLAECLDSGKNAGVLAFPTLERRQKVIAISASQGTVLVLLGDTTDRSGLAEIGVVLPLLGAVLRQEGFAVAEARATDLAAPLKTRKDELHAAVRTTDLEIAPRREAKGKLFESEERLRLILDAAQLGTWEWDISHDRFMVDAHLAALLDAAPKSRASFTAMVHPDDRESVLDAMCSAAENGDHGPLEFRIVRPDGEIRWMQATQRLIGLTHRASGTVLGVVQDVAERKRAEVRFRAVIEHSPHAMVMVNRQGKITLVNAETERLFGYPREELIAQPVEILVPERFRETHVRYRSAFLSDARARTMGATRDLFGLCKNGTEVPVEIGLNPIDTEEGVAVLASIIDIAARKQIEVEREALLALERKARKEAEAAIRAKDEFLALVSHELRAPLNAMLGWTQLLKSEKHPDPAMVGKATAVILRNIDLQRQLIDDLLDIARVVGGKLKLEVKPVNLVPVIDAAIDVVRPAAAGRGIELLTSIDTETSQISGDPQRLQQIVWNLLSNAIKFTPPGGQVRLCLKRVDPYVRIAVSDTGKGIAPEFLPYVFDRFRQADSSSTRRHGGLGLGLALVKHLVELHGGRVMVESPGEGQGATFSLDLPMSAVRVTTAVAEAYPEDESYPEEEEIMILDDLPSLEGLGILVADDQEEARELVCTVLERCGAVITAVASGHEALEVLEESLQNEPPDVFVCDIGMPELDGYGVIRRLRIMEKQLETAPVSRIPAIALTAYSQPADRVRALRAGFQMHLAKPVEPAELVLAIATLARSRRLPR